MRAAINWARANFPKPPHVDADWRAWVGYWIVKSRRKGLTEREFIHFVQTLIMFRDCVARLNNRWLVSIFDTLTDGGRPICAAVAGFWLCEKMNRPTGRQNKDGGSPTISTRRPDAHKNFFRRLRANMHQIEWELFCIFWERLAEDTKTITGKFYACVENPGTLPTAEPEQPWKKQ